MKHPTHRLVQVLAIATGMSFVATTFAGSCPKNLTQDSQGYWSSNEPPGWKSPQPTDKKVTLEAKNFGGAVYSPSKKRIACVYKDSSGKWIAILSNIYHPFNEDDLKGNAWQYSQKHKDYICGQPKYELKDCTFEIKK